MTKQYRWTIKSSQAVKISKILIIGVADHNTSTGKRSQRSRKCQGKSPSDDSGKQCVLCGRIEKYTTRFAHWGDNEKDFVVRYLGSKPPDESYVCKRDLLEAKRHHDTPNHIPKWKNPNSKPIAKYNCSHPKCILSQRGQSLNPLIA